jgi:hypothetical protein
LALPASVVGLVLYAQGQQVGVYLGHGYKTLNVVWRFLKGVGSWWWVMVMQAAGDRIASALFTAQGRGGLRRLPGTLLETANQMALPFYVLHHPIVVAVGYGVVGWRAGIWAKYVVIVVASLLLTVAACLVASRTAFGRFMLGMRVPRDAGRTAKAAPG